MHDNQQSPKRGSQGTLKPHSNLMACMDTPMTGLFCALDHWQIPGNFLHHWNNVSPVSAECWRAKQSPRYLTRNPLICHHVCPNFLSHSIKHGTIRILRWSTLSLFLPLSFVYSAISSPQKIRSVLILTGWRALCYNFACSASFLFLCLLGAIPHNAQDLLLALFSGSMPGSAQ